MIPPADGHDWLSLIDEHNDIWLFDVTFLLSGYQCIYGNGCASISDEPNPDESLGCCVHGAHMVNKKDRKNVLSYTSRLTQQDWQFKELAESKGGPLKLKKKSDSWVTRKTDGACIFLNRADFAGGAGCALHQAALREGERPLDWKPDVCWQVPIRLDIHTDDYGRDTVFVRAWERSDWGEGGQEFGWWCTEEAEPYFGKEPVYVSSRDELTEMVGPDLYRKLESELDQRSKETKVYFG